MNWTGFWKTFWDKANKMVDEQDKLKKEDKKIVKKPKQCKQMCKCAPRR